jgi:hypothetical protein
MHSEPDDLPIGAERDSHSKRRSDSFESGNPYIRRDATLMLDVLLDELRLRAELRGDFGLELVEAVLVPHERLQVGIELIPERLRVPRIEPIGRCSTPYHKVVGSFVRRGFVCETGRGRSFRMAA